MARVSQPSPLAPARQRAHALASAGDLAGARAILERAVELGRENLSEDDPDVLLTAYELGTVLQQADDPVAARRVLEEAYAAGQWRLGDSDPLMLQISHDIGAVAEELGNRHEARKAFGRVAERGAATLGDGHWAVARARAYLGQDPVRHEPAPPSSQVAPTAQEPSTLGTAAGVPGYGPGSPTSAQARTSGYGPDSPLTPQAGITGYGPGTPPTVQVQPHLALHQPSPDPAQAPPPGITGAQGPPPASTSAYAAPSQATSAYAPPQQASSTRPTQPPTSTTHTPPPTASTPHGQAGAAGVQPPSALNQQLWTPTAAPRRGNGIDEPTAAHPVINPRVDPAIPRQPAAPPMEVTGQSAYPDPEPQRMKGVQPHSPGPAPVDASASYGRKGLGIFAAVAAVLASVIAVAALVFVLANRSGDAGGKGDVPTLAGAPPTGVELLDAGSRITVTWQDPSPGTVSFVVSMGRPGQQLQPAGTLSPGSTSFAMEGLNPSLDYCFSVVAVYRADQVAPSPQVCTGRGSATPR